MNVLIVARTMPDDSEKSSRSSQSGESEVRKTVSKIVLSLRAGLWRVAKCAFA